MSAAKAVKIEDVKADSDEDSSYEDDSDDVFTWSLISLCFNYYDNQFAASDVFSLSVLMYILLEFAHRIQM